MPDSTVVVEVANMLASYAYLSGDTPTRMMLKIPWVAVNEAAAHLGYGGDPRPSVADLATMIGIEPEDLYRAVAKAWGVCLADEPGEADPDGEAIVVIMC